MKKVGLKKYTIFLLVCFFALIGTITAATTRKETKDNVTFGMTIPIGSNYSGLDCKADGLNIVNLTKTNSGKYNISLNSVPAEDGSESFTCTYDYVIDEAERKSGNVTFTINYKNSTSYYYEVLLGFGSYTHNIMNELGATRIISYNVQEKGNEYIDITCSETSCGVEVSQRAKDMAGSGQNLISIVEIVYIDANGKETSATIKYNVNAFHGATAWVNHSDPTPLGTCSFNSDWKKETYERDNGHKIYYYTTTNLNTVLPECKVNSNTPVPIEFGGWVEGVSGDTSISEGLGDYAEIYSLGTCDDAVKAGSVTLKDDGHYAPCYKYKPFVRLALSTEGTISGSGWTSTDGGYGYVATSSSTSNTIQLPTVTFSGFNKNVTFECWYNNSTGKCHNPGESVPYDGTTYSAKTSRTTTYTSEYKSVKLGKVFFLNTQGIKGCSVDGSGSSYVSASMQNGECAVAGNVLTPSKTYADVIVNLEDGTLRTYKFSVVEDNTLSSANNGEFIIDLSPPDGGDSGESANGEGESHVSASGSTNECDTFTIVKGGSMSIGGGLNSTIYSVNSQCASDDNEYIALCLDPGRLGPNSYAVKYKRDADINPNKEMGYLVNYFATHLDMNNFRVAQNDIRAAAHITARIVANANGFDKGSLGGSYWDAHYLPYDNMGSWFANSANKNKSEAEYASKLDDYFDLNDNIKSLVAKYLAEFQVQSASIEDQENFGFNLKKDNIETVVYGSTGYKITYKGSITAPKGITSLTLQKQAQQDANGANYGVSFSVDSWVHTGTGADGELTYDYVLTITATDTRNVKVPKTQDEKNLLAFELAFEGGNLPNSIFIATPEDRHNDLQRMLLFNLSQPKILLYFDIVPTECELPGLDYTVCENPDSPDCANFNGKLFVEAGCCDEIEDEVKFEYVVQNICGGECTTSTLTEVCSYDPSNLGQTDLYEFHEGSKHGVGNSIGECIVNVSTKFDNTKVTDYYRYDDAGNLLNVEEYDDNDYCQVTCKEDWQITMDSFGNYAGENAVAAGHYFQIVNNDIFIGGKRTCYTTYVDYERYANDLVQDGKTFVNLYNDYSNKSHAYSDYDKQKDESNWNFTFDKVTTYDRTGSCTSTENSCPNTLTGEDPCAGTYSVSCSQSTETAVKDYWTYTLGIRSTNSDFEDPEAGKGKYIKYVGDEETKVDDSSGTANNGDYTEWILDTTNTKPTLYTDDGLSKPNSLTVCYNSGDQPCTPEDGGSCDWECSDTGSGYKETEAGSDATSTHKEAFGEMKTERMGDLADAMSGLAESMTGLRIKMDNRVKDMYDCQHFQLDNTSDGDSGTYSEHANTDSLTGTLYYKGGSKETVKIETMFEPYTEYKYDEDAYMTILLQNKENYLEQFKEKNDKEFGGDWANATNDFKVVEIEINGQPHEVNLARNYMDFDYYAVGYNDMWEADSDKGKNYGANGTETGLNKPKSGVFDLTAGNRGTSDDSTKDGQRLYKKITVCSVNGEQTATNTTKSETEGLLQAVTKGYIWEGGSCYEFYAPYIAANYISTSIENSSFYKNEGYWYGSSEDLKEHGADLSTALQSAVSKRPNMYKYDVSAEVSSGKWSPIGLFNVFPISITTPRNLYTYTYDFYDIGSYYDGDLGRILGGEGRDRKKAIIQNNSRTCFYEVYEELCLCCGDKINTYVYGEDLTASMISQFAGQIGYQLSDVDKIETNTGGTLAFATATVNLSDIHIDAPNRDVADNWSDSSYFTYAGETHLTTGKGAELMSYIESYGEKIYSKTTNDKGPEYAYYLTPTTLSSFREYNESHGYGVNFDELVGYGRYRIAKGPNGEWTADHDDFNNSIINFQHYGSKFLEELASLDGVVVPGTLATSSYSHDDDCFVTEGFTNDQLYEKSKTCRWVDYIEIVSNNSVGETYYEYPQDSVSGSGTVTEFRLVFK